MRAMGKRTITALAALALVACGGGGKGADSPGTCPAGTTLKGSDCVPSGDDDSAGSSGGGTGGTGGTGKSGDDGDKSGGSSAGGGDAPSSGSTPYDKDAVDVQLKRGARQVKANCGAATDENGASTGPWGKTTITVKVGHNGHSKGGSVPAPFDGKATGRCVVQAFSNLIYAPFPGGDADVDWPVEITKP